LLKIKTAAQTLLATAKAGATNACKSGLFLNKGPKQNAIK